MANLSKLLYSKVSNRSVADILMSFALFAGLVFTIAFILNTVNNSVCSILSFLLQVYGVKIIIDPIIYIRNSQEEEVFTYRQAYRGVLRVSIFTAVVSCFLKFIYLNFIAKDYLNDYVNTMLNAFRDAEMEISIEQAMALEQLREPIRFVMYNLIGDFIGAILLALIAAIFIKRKIRY